MSKQYSGLRQSLTFWGLIATLVFGLVSVASVVLVVWPKRPMPTLEIRDRIDTINASAGDPRLQILFDGESLLANKRNLRMLTVRLVNRGNQAILQGFYEPQDPWRIVVTGGEVVSASVVECSEEYLETAFGDLEFDWQRILLPSVILESSDYVIMKIGILHDRDVNPDLALEGKIAHVEAQPVMDLARRGFKAEIEQGPILVFLTIVGGIYLVVLFILFPAMLIRAARGRARRRQNVRSFAAAALMKEDHPLFSLYVDRPRLFALVEQLTGGDYIIDLREQLLDRHELARLRRIANSKLGLLLMFPFVARVVSSAFLRLPSDVFRTARSRVRLRPEIREVAARFVGFVNGEEVRFSYGPYQKWMEEFTKRFKPWVAEFLDDVGMIWDDEGERVRGWHPSEDKPYDVHRAHDRHHDYCELMVIIDHLRNDQWAAQIQDALKKLDACGLTEDYASPDIGAILIGAYSSELLDEVEQRLSEVIRRPYGVNVYLVQVGFDGSYDGYSEISVNSERVRKIR